MDNKNQKVFVILSASLLVLMGAVITGCVEDDDPDVDTIRFGMTTEPVDWHPIESSEHQARHMLANIFDPLVHTYPDGEANTEGKALAEDFEISEDGLTYTFEIKEGVMFHEPYGEELTAEDIAFTLDTIRGGIVEDKYDVDADPASPVAGSIGHIESVEVVDDYELEITLEERDAELLRRPGFSFTYVVPKGYIVENGWDAYEEEMIGTGGYRHIEYRPGTAVELEAHEDYHAGEPAIDEVIFEFYDDATPAVSALEAGEIHYIPEMPPLTWQDMQEDPVEGVELGATPGFGHKLVSFNHNEYFDDEPNPFADARVRKAWAYAICEDEVRSIVQGRELTEDYRGFAHPGDAYYDEDLYQYEQDFDKAAELLEEAGYDEDNPVEAELTSIEGTWVPEAELMKDQVENVAFDVEIITTDTIVADKEAGIVQLGHCGWSGRDVPTENMGYIMADDGLEFYGGWYGQYAEHGEEVTELLEDARTVLDDDERVEMYKEAQRLLVEEDMGHHTLYTRDYPKAYASALDIPEESWNRFMGVGPMYVIYEWELEE